MSSFIVSAQLHGCVEIKDVNLSEVNLSHQPLFEIVVSDIEPVFDENAQLIGGICGFKTFGRLLLLNQPRQNSSWSPV